MMSIYKYVRFLLANGADNRWRTGKTVEMVERPNWGGFWGVVLCKSGHYLVSCSHGAEDCFKGVPLEENEVPEFVRMIDDEDWYELHCKYEGRC